MAGGVSSRGLVALRSYVAWRLRLYGLLNRALIMPGGRFCWWRWPGSLLSLLRHFTMLFYRDWQAQSASGGFRDGPGVVVMGGGLVCLTIVLVALVGESGPWFGLDPARGEGARATGVLVCLWLAVFSLPLFVWTPDNLGSPASSRGFKASAGLIQPFKVLTARLADCLRRPVLWRFLLAHMLYADGLTTLLAFGGVFAAGVYGLSLSEVVIFGIAINVSAGLGAVVFAWIDDYYGARRTVLMALIGLIVLGVGLVLGSGKIWFWVCGLGMGLFVGPAQAASRSLMAHLVPPGQEAAGFGLFALSGKATAFVGPLVLGWVTHQSGSQRIGMATVLIFLSAGALLLWQGTRDGGEPAMTKKNR